MHAPPLRAALVLALCAIVLLNLAFWAPSIPLPSAPWTSTSRPSTSQPDDDGRIVLTMVLFGRASAEEGQHMIKSVLQRSSAPVQLHLVCSHDAVPILQRRIALVTRPVHDVEVIFYPLSEAAVVARGERAGIGNKRHHAGVGGLAKMFIHDLLPVPQTLYVDTDALFLTDPLLLWHQLLRTFHSSNPNNPSSDPNSSPSSSSSLHSNEVLLAFPHAGPQSDGGEICTCVMALHLARMRAAPYLESTNRPSTLGRAMGSKEVWERAGIDPARPPWGDQGLTHALWRAHPQRYARLPRVWDVSACRVFYGVTLVGEDFRTPAQERAKLVNLGYDQDDLNLGDGDGGDGGVMFPGIVHFNCQGGEKEENVFTSETLRSRPEWGPALAAAAAYKWVWLNQGSGTLTMRVVDNATFFDEVDVGAR